MTSTMKAVGREKEAQSPARTYALAADRGLSQAAVGLLSAEIGGPRRSLDLEAAEGPNGDIAGVLEFAYQSRKPLHPPSQSRV